METNNHPINPLLLSWKLRDVRNFELPEMSKQIEEEPRLIELAFFLQWVSNPRNYPGGLAKFTSDFIEEYRDRIGTPAVRRGIETNSFTLEDAELAMSELPEWRGKNVYRMEMEEFESLDDFLAGSIEESTDEARAKFVKGNLPRQLIAEAVQTASHELSGYFRAICEQQNIAVFRSHGLSSIKGSADSYPLTPIFGAPWYWPTVCRDLLEWMDRREESVMSEIAETRVSKMVLKWVRRSRECGMPVWLTGSCRFGKTESLRALAKANPGRYRIVETPDDSSVLSLCTAIAEALGIDCMKDTALVLRGKIGDVLDASGIMLLVDEAHFLLPMKITRNTRPQRLDFIRRAVIDRGHPIVFVSTPQSYLEARRKFEKATGYTMGQWDGRLLREEPVELPEEIDEDEKLAVAAIHMPGFDSDYLKYVVARVSAVRGSSVYAQIAKVAAMAFVVARENGRKRPSVADIKEASAEVLPSLPEATSKIPSAERQKPLKAAVADFFPAQNRSTELCPPKRETRVELVSSKQSG